MQDGDACGGRNGAMIDRADIRGRGRKGGVGRESEDQTNARNRSGLPATDSTSEKTHADQTCSEQRKRHRFRCLLNQNTRLRGNVPSLPVGAHDVSREVIPLIIRDEIVYSDAAKLDGKVQWSGGAIAAFAANFVARYRLEKLAEGRGRVGRGSDGETARDRRRVYSWISLDIEFERIAGPGTYKIFVWRQCDCNADAVGALNQRHCSKRTCAAA